ncbi:MAG: DUF2332 domain-containing protein [Actinomycetota bacterium]
MGDPWDDADLVRRFRESANAAERRSPLNAALSRIVARDRSLATLLGHAPAEQQLPVLLLAAVHHELLADRDHELARWYPNLTPSPASPDDRRLPEVFTSFVHDHSASILKSLATRHVQTNEVGRTALLVAGLGEVTSVLEGRPLAHLDVGTSAGLNLLLDRLRYRFVGDDGATHPLRGSAAGGAAPEIVADVRGRLDLPDRMPTVTARRGLDLHPIDLDDAVNRRWLEACVWPDQADRFARLRAALELARSDPPELVRGDAVDSLADHVEDLQGHGVPLVTTTWVLNYVPTDRRRAFVDTLDQLGSAGDLMWVFAEAPALTQGLPHAPEQQAEHRTAVTRVTWRGGERVVDHVAIAHPHGYWIHADAAS